MRIMTRTQYDAIVDIVTEQKKRIEELEAELQKRKDQVKALEESIRKKNESIDYVNDLLFTRTKELVKLRFEKTPIVHIASIDDLDFPATSKPENKLF